MITANIKCEICNDTRYIKVGDGFSPCGCQSLPRERKKYESLLTIGKPMPPWTFENFNPKTEKQTKIYNMLKNRHGGYYLFGTFGVGKSHLMHATAIQALQNNIMSAVVLVPDFLDIIRKSGQYNHSEIESLFQTIPYLCLDDIGKERITDWVAERLFILIEKRSKLHLLNKAQTSFTSQIPLDRLHEHLDGGIASRIKGMTYGLHVDGEDQRKYER